MVRGLRTTVDVRESTVDGKGSTTVDVNGCTMDPPLVWLCTVPRWEPIAGGKRLYKSFSKLIKQNGLLRLSLI